MINQKIFTLENGSILDKIHVKYIMHQKLFDYPFVSLNFSILFKKAISKMVEIS